MVFHLTTFGLVPSPLPPLVYLHACICIVWPHLRSPGADASLTRSLTAPPPALDIVSILLFNI